MRSVLGFLFLGLALAVPLVAEDGMLVSWSPQNLEGMTEARWNAAKSRSPQEILKLNREAKTWPEVYEVVLGASQIHPRRISSTA